MGFEYYSGIVASNMFKSSVQVVEKFYGCIKPYEMEDSSDCYLIQNNVGNTCIRRILVRISSIRNV